MLVQDVFNGTRSSFHRDNTSWEIRKWDGLLALRSPPLVDDLDALALLSLFFARPLCSISISSSMDCLSGRRWCQNMVAFLFGSRVSIICHP
jgi:hypothetical protein